MGAGGVSFPPREAQSCQGYSRNIVMWGERGEAKLASLYVHYTYTLKQLTLAKLQGIFGGVMKAPIVAPVAILWRRRWTISLQCRHPWQRRWQYHGGCGPTAWQGTISDRRVGYGEVIQHGAVRCKLRALHFENTHDNLSHHFFPRKLQTSQLPKDIFLEQHRHRSDVEINFDKKKH